MESELDRLRKKVENFPSASLYTRLAELQRQAGDLTGAETTCRRCIREFPRSAQAYVILAEMRLAAGARPEAAQLIATAIDKEPRSYQALSLAAELADHPHTAARHLQAILAFKPGDAAILARLHQLGPQAQGAPAAASAPVKAPASAPTSAIVSAPASAPSTTRSIRAASAPLPLDQPLPMPTLTPTAAPTAAPVTASVRAAAPSPKGSALQALVHEAGVRGACVADHQGRILATQRLTPGQDDLLAALGAELLRAASTSLTTAGAPAANAFSLTAAAGQVLAFTRDRRLLVLVLADAGVRPAMLELRARQALIDLGAV